MPSQTTGAMNPIWAMLPPDQQQNLAQLQQQQAIGQALLQEGMQPLDTSNRQVGGVGYRISPLEGLSKIVQAAVGNKMARDSAGQQAQIYGQMYGNAFGGAQQPATQQPQQAPVDAGGMTGGQSGPGVVSSPVPTPGAPPSGPQLGVAMGGAAPTQAAPQQQLPSGALTLPGKTPQQSMLIYSMLGPDAYGRMLEQQSAPTAATLAARQGGFDPTAANRAQFSKDSLVAPITGTGIYRDPRTMQPVGYNPELPAGTTPLFDASGNVAQAQAIPGAQGVMQGNAAATAAGGAQFKPVQVYNPATKQMEYSNEAAVTNPTAPAPRPLANGMPPTQDGTPNGAPMTPLQRSVMNTESFGNPNSVSPKGAVGSMQTMPATLQNPGFGVKPPQNNSPAELQRVGVDFLGAMQNRYGNDSDALVAYNMGPAAADKWIAGGRQWSQLPAQTQQYVGKTIAQAQNYQSAPATGATPSGAPAAAAPLGAVSNANAAQQASADSMKASYTKLQAVNSTANSALDALQKMQTLAASKSPALTAGPLGTVAAPIVSPDAAEYEKQRANVVQMLSNQNGTNTSDAGRQLTGDSVPDYGKPKSAIQDGLQTQINQVRAQQLKANVLTPVYQSGDSKTYTALENQFDQTVKPSMMPQLSTLMTMPAGPQRAIALTQAIKDPQMKSALDLMVNTGQIK